jgi:hypothetical protein
MRVFRRLLCCLPWPIWFHRPEIIETYDSATRKLRCTVCGQYFAMSYHHQAVLPWDEDYERLTCDIYGIPRSKV